MEGDDAKNRFLMEINASQDIAQVHNKCSGQQAKSVSLFLAGALIHSSLDR